MNGCQAAVALSSQAFFGWALAWLDMVHIDQARGGSRA